MCGLVENMSVTPFRHNGSHIYWEDRGEPILPWGGPAIEFTGKFPRVPLVASRKQSQAPALFSCTASSLEGLMQCLSECLTELSALQCWLVEQQGLPQLDFLQGHFHLRICSGLSPHAGDCKIFLKG